jgi:hypothetical protein
LQQSKNDGEGFGGRSFSYHSSEYTALHSSRKHYVHTRIYCAAKLQMQKRKGEDFCNLGAWNEPSKFQDGLGTRRRSIFRPSQEMKLSHRPRLTRLQVLQVKASDQVLVTPNVLAHQVDLK